MKANSVKASSFWEVYDEQVLNKKPEPEPVKLLYKVVKVFRVSGKHKVLRRYLSLEEAKRVVNSYPDSSRSMVVFYKMNDVC